MPATTKDRRCVGGPMHGWPVSPNLIRGSQAWIDRLGRCYPSFAAGRALYRISGDEVLRHVRNARQCDGCGVTIDSHPVTGERLPVCPLCGAPE